MSTPLDVFTNRPVRTETLTFPVDPSDGDKLKKLKEEASKKRRFADLKPDDHQRSSEADEAEQELKDFVDSVRTITFTIQAVGDKRVEELMTAYPATKEQKTKARKAASGDPKAEPLFNEDTFFPALLAESVVSIVDSQQPDSPQTEVTVEQMTAMWNSVNALSTTDRVELTSTALMVNQQPSSIEDLGKG